MIIKRNRLVIILAIVGGILLIPFLAMQFTAEVNWGPLDFLVAGVLLLATALAIDVVLQKVERKEYQLLLSMALLVMLLLVIAELGVGLFGTPFAGS